MFPKGFYLTVTVLALFLAFAFMKQRDTAYMRGFHDGISYANNNLLGMTWKKIELQHIKRGK